MAQNKAAVEKRRLEIEVERLDQEIKYIYMQKESGSSYMQIKYKSGRVITNTTTNNAN